MSNVNSPPCVLLGGQMEPMRNLTERYARGTCKLPVLCVPCRVDAGTQGVAEPSGVIPRWEQQELFPIQPSEG